MNEQTINFKNFKFLIKQNKIALVCKNGEGYNFNEVQIAGENKDTHLGAKMANSSEGGRLFYVSHEINGDMLIIKQRSQLVEVKTFFKGFNDSSAVRIYCEVKNITNRQITLEEVSAFCLYGIGKKGEENALYFTRFPQSHHYECQPITRSFSDYGFNSSSGNSQKKISFSNVGSWSTKEEVPQAIIENRNDKSFLMFEIESNNSWYYEVSDKDEQFYLYLGGANLPNGGWCKKLAPNESYTTPNVAIAFSSSLEGVIAEITKYRRHISPNFLVDQNQSAIFNEYMHLSWDSPTEENTKKVAQSVCKTGVKYYVIDCGWHDEEDGNIIYPYVGKWKESKKRFPNGVRQTTDYIRSLGMKAGLWIEPEIIGVKCKEMLEFYDDDCFITRHGEKVCVMNRYFLDFRAKKVVDYMTETIRRMVEDYGADYIKLDYNQDLGIGTDKYGTNFGEGLELCASAYLKWVEDITQKFPNVLFETCSSGGMRMDYQTLSHFSIVSTSDQTDYLKYPYIVSNMLSCVLPEQAAVWSYPVGVGEIGKPLPYNAEWVQENITKDAVAFNMINSFLGRMHLASHINYLSNEQFDLVVEGVNYYNKLTKIKKQALPFLPKGFSNFVEDNLVAGLKANGKIYLAVWHLRGEKQVEINLPSFKNAVIAYPTNSNVKVKTHPERLSLLFTADKQAVFLEID